MSEEDLANDLAVQKIASCRPVLTELVTASEAIGLGQGELGHAGPPFEEGDVLPVVVRNALAGAVLHEKWAGTVEEAYKLIDEGEIRLRPNHSLRTVSPMSGVVRPNQRLFRVEDQATGDSTYATLAEKGRHVLRFGFYDEAVGDKLRHLETTIAEDIRRAIPNGGLPLLPLIERAVKFGDDVHQRNEGGLLSFLAALPQLSGTTREWATDHPQHFLNYAMAAAKLCLDQARGVAGSSIVTAISRNGLNCGVQVAGLEGRWFSAPADTPTGILFAPFTKLDTHRDLGDSAIMEAFGLGGCIAHLSPEIAATMRRPWDEAVASGHQMRKLFVDQNRSITPALAGSTGVGIGLDAVRVARLGVGVCIHTGIAHKDGTEGWIGIGVANAPVECFALASQALAVSGSAPT